MINTQIVQFQSHFCLQISDVGYDKYLLSHDQKPAIFAENQPFFHNHSTNICRIGNSNAGCQRAAKTEHSRYWPSHHTIRTQRLNWSQRWWNRIVGTTVRCQPDQIPMALFPVWVTNQAKHSGSGSLAVPNPDPGLGSSSNPDRSQVTRNSCWYYWNYINTCCDMQLDDQDEHLEVEPAIGTNLMQFCFSSEQKPITTNRLQIDPYSRLQSVYLETLEIFAFCNHHSVNPEDYKLMTFLCTLF